MLLIIQDRSGCKCDIDSKANGVNEDYNWDHSHAVNDARLLKFDVYGRDIGDKCLNGTPNKRGFRISKTSVCHKYSLIGEGVNIFA